MYVVLVKNLNDKWKMCINFINLNKACLKDHYLLPTIDKLVDSTTGHSICSLVDAILGYHQIKMDPKNEENTIFIMNMGIFCYKVMAFGLNNVGATY